MNQPQYRQDAPPPPPAKSGGVPVWLIAILVVVGAIVLIGGTLVVLAITGMRRYLAAAKTAEARNSLGQMRDAVASYEREESAMGAPTLVSKHVLCASASQPVPLSFAQVSGKKYMSSPADWDVDKAAKAGFSCLRFQMTMPQYYQYSYDATGTRSAVGDGFTVTAHGDLNGNGVPSTFTLGGKIGAGDVVTVWPSLVETSPEE